MVARQLIFVEKPHSDLGEARHEEILDRLGQSTEEVKIFSQVGCVAKIPALMAHHFGVPKSPWAAPRVDSVQFIGHGNVGRLSMGSTGDRPDYLWPTQKRALQLSTMRVHLRPETEVMFLGCKTGGTNRPRPAGRAFHLFWSAFFRCRVYTSLETLYAHDFGGTGLVAASRAKLMYDVEDEGVRCLRRVEGKIDAPRVKLAVSGELPMGTLQVKPGMTDGARLRLLPQIARKLLSQFDFDKTFVPPVAASPQLRGFGDDGEGGEFWIVSNATWLVMRPREPEAYAFRARHPEGARLVGELVSALEDLESTNLI